MRRVLIVEDHSLTRLGLTGFVRQACGEVEIVEADCARTALELVRQGRWDLVLLDLGLPDRSGLDVLTEMRQADPKLRALMVSGCVDEALVRRALQSGASGFVEKGAPLDELRKAMQTVMAGERYISHEMSSRLALLSVDNAGRPSAESLSNREFLVLRQLGTGKTVSEVAAELCLSVKTVSTYRTRLLRKLNLHSTAELVRYAIKGGWA